MIGRLSGVYNAPWGITTAISYALQAGRWSGPILTRIAAPDPQFGPPTVQLSTGRVVSNPLSTVNRFAFPTRGEGQFELPALHVVNLRVGRAFHFSSDRRFQIDVDVFNVGNMGRPQGFLANANQLFSTNYGRGGLIQQPMSAQLSVRAWF